MNMLVDGRNATGSLLCNLFFMLATNPAIWAKLRREVSGLKDSRQRMWS
jgi:cytochrome P450